jgi:predicted RNA binding protein YcfA (HicA-like mRNA interferase family)
VRAFQRAGWRLTRQESSHLILTKPGTYLVLSVPDHRTLSRGVLRSLIRKSGLDVDRFVALL